MIHKTSIIDKNAKISKTAKIGPYSIIGSNVEIGDEVEIHSHANIVGNTKIGSETKIFPFASIGTQPQDLKYKGEKNSLVIGKNNIIREYVTINPGTESGGTITKIGDNCLLMISSHVAHDCQIGNNVVIEDSVIIGGNSAVQQFTRVGRLAMVGGMTGVLKDVIPFGLSFGNRNYLKGINLIGLRRNKYENKIIMELGEAYKKIFSSKNLHENLSKINGEFKDNKLVQEVTEFISKDKKRPICTPQTR